MEIIFCTNSYKVLDTNVFLDFFRLLNYFEGYEEKANQW